MGDDLLGIVARLPRGAGIVFRHYELAASERRALFEQVRRIAQRRGLVLILAGSGTQAKAWRADGVHGRNRRHTRALLRAAPVHTLHEMAAARRVGAQIVFISPVFLTRSHPGAPALGRMRFAQLAQQAHAFGMAPIALGGMTAWRARTLPHAHGWAGIDAFL
ncbi:MAG: thiamine phosphate synthase [Alphaproteobacteria bacterium]|nr:thiamine phosphate synthase [Alphaproteobacteria bacterium]